MGDLSMAVLKYEATTCQQSGHVLEQNPRPYGPVWICARCGWERW